MGWVDTVKAITAVLTEGVRNRPTDLILHQLVPVGRRGSREPDGVGVPKRPGYTSPATALGQF